MEGEGQEEEEAGSYTAELVPTKEQEPELQAILPVVPELFATGLSTEVAGCGLAMSKRVQGKALATEVKPEPPALTNEQLVR